MVTKVGLANMALDLLGVGNIASLAESSVAARKVNARIDDAILAALAMSDWTFARKIAALAEVTNDDWDQRYEFKYDLPNDLLAAIRIVPEIDAPNQLPVSYALANGALYTHEPEARLQYTYTNTDVGSWPMSFTETVAAYIARAVAYPLTLKRQHFIDMNAIFNEQLGTAIAQDAAQEQTFWAYPSEYLEARGASSRNGDGRGVDGSTYWTS
jgi:hypothetical protein